MSERAGFLTTHDQQQVRRFLLALPLRLGIYSAGAAGWLLGPARALEQVPLWRSFAVQAGILIHVALIEFALALQAEGLWGGPPWARLKRRGRRWLAPLGLAALAFVGGLGLRW